MRLKKQLSGGRVPHLLWGQGTARAALSRGHQGAGPSPGPAPGRPEHPLLVPISPRGFPLPLRAPREERGWVRPGPRPPTSSSPHKGDVIQRAAGAGAIHAARLVVIPAGSKGTGWGGLQPGSTTPGGHHALDAHWEPRGRSRNTQLPALAHTAPGWQRGWSRACSHRQLRACRERGARAGNGSQGHGHPAVPTPAGPGASSAAF